MRRGFTLIELLVVIAISETIISGGHEIVSSDAF
jgi:Tfp pilus assembly protein FimT